MATKRRSWRYAEEADIPAINTMAARAIRVLHAGGYDQAVIEEAVEHAYGVDWQLVRDRTYYVIEIDGELAGAGGWSGRKTIAGAHGQDDPASEHLDPEQDAARIRAFYVDPDHARQGIGALLIELSERDAHEAGFSRIELTSTLPAIPFYTAFGYRLVEDFTLPLPSGAGLPLKLMEKALA